MTPDGAGSHRHALAGRSPSGAARGGWADPSTNGRAVRWHGTRWADAVGAKDRLYFLYSDREHDHSKLYLK